MKFGKYIQSQQAEWAGPDYLNYKGLKKIINSLQKDRDWLAATGAGLSAEEKQAAKLQALKTAFFFQLERELEKVNTFYLQKEADLQARLKIVLEKKRIAQGRQKRLSHASLITLREGTLQFRHDLTKLQRFVEVNAEGFRKILKKWDKRSKSSTKELYLSRQVEIQPCFNRDVLAELTDQATTVLAEIEHLLSEEDPETVTALEAHSVDHSAIGESILINALKCRNALAVREFLASLRKPSREEVSGGDREALSKILLRFCTSKEPECIDLLLESNLVSLNIADDISGRTCLHELAIANREETLEKFIRKGSKVEVTDAYGRTPLHYATMNGQASITRYLISVAANINAVDDDGCTPLVYAIRAGHADCVEILIENGATVEPISSTAPIPLSIACEHGHSQIVMLLLSKGAQLTADLNGLFPLHLASREGHQDVSRLLLSHGADVDAADGLNGWTPIFYAASEGHLECVQVLLEVGARIDMVDEYGWTPVTYALYRGHIKIAELLELKMDPGFSSKQGQSPPKVDNIKPMAPSELFSAAPDRSNSPTPMDLDLDELPDLSLPPPIIPFRIYGHAFLDKKAHIRVTLKGQSASHPGPVSLKESQQMTSLKLVISGKPEVGVPYHVILPLQDDLEVHTFLVEDTASFSLQFDVFPTFGTKPIGRAVVLPSQIAALTRRRWVGPGEQESAVLPLFDPHLRVVGEVQCNLEIVTPFAHPSLQIGGKVETYWKSTKLVAADKADGTHSFITASSLAEEYIQVVVQLTNDGIPVIYPHWRIANPENSVKLSVGNFSFELARKSFELAKKRKSEAASPSAAPIIPPVGAPQPHRSPSSGLFPRSPLGQAQNGSPTEISRHIYDSFLSLHELLQTLPHSIGVSILLKYPTTSERLTHNLTQFVDINTFVDTILQVVYDQAAAQPRSIIFMSFNASVCTAMNWKQPNYGVFFATHCGYPNDEDSEEGTYSANRWPREEPLPPPETFVEYSKCRSLKGAIRFAKSNNLLGIVCEASPLVKAPTLIKTVKESGLILGTCGSANADPDNVRIQERHGVDAIVVDNVFRYNVNLT